MSQENVQGFHAAFEAWKRGDMETWLQSMHPQVEWDISAFPLPGAPTHGTGREGFVRWQTEYLDMWVSHEATVKEVIDAGDELVVVLHETVRARGSETPIERDLSQVVTVRDRRAVRFRYYRTKEEALEAAGLSE